MRVVQIWDVAREARYVPKVPPIVGVAALSVACAMHLWGMLGLAGAWVALALVGLLCLAARGGGLRGGVFGLIAAAAVVVAGLVGVDQLGRHYGAGLIALWLTCIGLGLLLGTILWWIWDRLLRVLNTAQMVTRRKHQANLHEGSASVWDLGQMASAGAIRRRARVLRPSLRTWTSWQLRRLPASAISVLLLQTGVKVGPWSGRMSVRSSIEQVTVRIGGPRMGKSKSLACHANDAPGALLATSTRDDLLVDTGARRSAMGRVVVFNPTGLGRITSSARWSPLSGCEDYPTAQRRAQDMIPDREGEGQIWSDQARRVFSVLLHAAALLPGGTMRVIQGWVASPGPTMRDAVIAALAGAKVPDALVQEIRQFAGINDRTKTSITASMALALAWLTSDRCAAIGDAPRDQWFGIREFVASGRDSLYLIGSPELSVVSPLISALTGEVAHHLRQVAGLMPEGRLDPPFAMVLDELALACPELPIDQYTADMGGRGVTIHISVQSLAQLRQKLGDTAAAALLNNANVLLVFGGTKDSRDLDALATLVGERLEQLDEDDRRYVHMMSPATISAMPTGEAFAVIPGMRPVLGRAPQVYEEAGYEPWSPPREPGAVEEILQVRRPVLVPAPRTPLLSGLRAWLRARWVKVPA